MGRLRNARAKLARMDTTDRAAVLSLIAAPCYDGLPRLGHCDEDVDGRGNTPRPTRQEGAGPAIDITARPVVLSDLGRTLWDLEHIVQLPTSRKITK